MRAFGLTGNIGCGKSTVASLLAKHPDVLVIDSDRVAKDIIASGTHKQAINALLGTDVYLSQQADMKRIAEIIFREPDKKLLFESLIHPLVWTTVQNIVDTAGAEKICIVESALIYETRTEDKFNAMIVVSCSPEEQERRLRDVRNMNMTDIRARMALQLSSPDKEARAQFIIRTDCTMSALESRVADLYDQLKQLSGVYK